MILRKVILLSALTVSLSACGLGSSSSGSNSDSENESADGINNGSGIGGSVDGDGNAASNGFVGGIGSDGQGGVAGVCVDLDGDGFGWDGTQSCIPGDSTGTGSDTGSANGFAGGNVSGGQGGEAGACVDIDGDGFGWDGTQSCIPGGPTVTVSGSATGSVNGDGSTNGDGSSSADGSTGSDGSASADGSTGSDGSTNSDGSASADGSTSGDGSVNGDASASADGSASGDVTGDTTSTDATVADGEVTQVGFVKVYPNKSRADFLQASFGRLPFALTPDAIQTSYAPTADTCEVIPVDSGSSDDSQFTILGQRLNQISGGETVEVSSGAGSYASLSRIDSSTGPSYATDTALNMEAPSGLSADVVGDDFPAFFSVPISDVPALQIANPAAGLNVDANTGFTWNGSNDPLTVMEVYTQGLDANGQEVLVGCTAIDDGNFEFPSSVRSRMGSSFDDDFTVFLRIAYNLTQNDDALVVTANSAFGTR